MQSFLYGAAMAVLAVPVHRSMPRKAPEPSSPHRPVETRRPERA
ncbi:hypothetical protein [Kitasatospora cheerisanensis]|nr:hypothetical protein [Kitasatospora cheerisanensis]